MMPFMGNPDIALSMLKHPVHCCALGFGSGLAPRAPGTAGSLVGLLIYLAVMSLPLPVYLVVVIVVVITGIAICGYTARVLNTHDHPAIVWDEIAGMLITLIMAPPGWLWALAGFVMFRAFDILKPWPIKAIDKGVGGGLGIMLDDVLAGIFALICLQTIHYLL